MTPAIHDDDPPEARPAAGQAQQYLTFVLGGGMFAFNILTVKEIIEYRQPTAVPMMPAYVRGVINLRGAVVPVLDLSMRFGRPVSPVTRRTCIVIVELDVDGGRLVAGVCVDGVNTVMEFAGGEIEPPPRFGVSISTNFIRGMARVNGQFVVLLDSNQLVEAQQLPTAETTRVSASQIGSSPISLAPEA
jgi:purine-binding chemotaxis protein CheW